MALNNIHYLFEAWTYQKLDISMRFHHEDIERRKARGLNVKKQNELRKKGASLKSCSGKADKLRAKLNRVTPRGKNMAKSSGVIRTMKDIRYNVISGVEVKANVYAGENCDQHEPYLESWCEGDMDSETSKEFSFDSKRWPVGTKLQVMVPMCPGEDCDVDADFQDENGKCRECGFDWNKWVEEQYS